MIVWIRFVERLLASWRQVVFLQIYKSDFVWKKHHLRDVLFGEFQTYMIAESIWFKTQRKDWPADIHTLWESHVIIKHSFEVKEGRLEVILKQNRWLNTLLTGRKCDILSCAIKNSRLWYLAYERWSRVRIVAELSAHLQVADAADGVPELCQGVGAHHQQRNMRSGEVKLWWEMDSGKMCNNLEESVATAMAVTHFFKDVWVENVDGQNDLSLWDHVVLWFWDLANGQTLLGVKHTGEKVFKGLYCCSVLQHYYKLWFINRFSTTHQFICIQVMSVLDKLFWGFEVLPLLSLTVQSKHTSIIFYSHTAFVLTQHDL